MSHSLTRCLVGFLLGLCASLVLAGCADSSSCTSDGDCFGGEVCRGGSCLVVTGGSNNGASNGTANNGAALACEVDDFAGCDDDSYEPNEEWIDSEHIFDANTPFGCFSEFREIHETVTSTLCARESADFYDFSYNTCKDHGYRIDFEFRPTIECTEELVGFEFLNHACDDENTQCEPLENGGLRVQHIVDATPVQSSNKAAYFSVSPGSTDQSVHVPYEIKVDLYKP